MTSRVEEKEEKAAKREEEERQRDEAKREQQKRMLEEQEKGMDKRSEMDELRARRAAEAAARALLLQRNAEIVMVSVKVPQLSVLRLDILEFFFGPPSCSKPS